MAQYYTTLLVATVQHQRAGTVGGLVVTTKAQALGQLIKISINHIRCSESHRRNNSYCQRHSAGG